MSLVLAVTLAILPLPHRPRSVASRNDEPPALAIMPMFIGCRLGTGDIFELNVLGFVVAVIASVALIGVAESLSGSHHREHITR